MLKIYAANLSERDYTIGAEDIMSPARLEKYKALGSPKAKNECAAVAFLLKKAGITEFYEASGKPCTQGKFISISHSGEWALLAVCDSPVGLDIEQHRAVDERAIAARMFTEKEQKSGHAFFDMWVRKESMLKKLGLGIGHRQADSSGHNFLRISDFIGYSAAACTEETEYEIIKI